MLKPFIKKILFLTLLPFLMVPKNGNCFQERDALMLAAGIVVVAGGVTFVIKSAKKTTDKNTPTQSQHLEMKLWLPQKELTSYDPILTR